MYSSTLQYDMVTVRLGQWGWSPENGQIYKGNWKFLSVTGHSLRVLCGCASAYFYFVGGKIIARVDISSQVKKISFN